MNKTEFCQTVASHILEYLPASYRDGRVELTDRLKDNDQLLTGLSIRREDESACPVIYLDQYYDQYRFKDKDMEDVMHEIAQEYDRVLKNRSIL